jgi:ATP-dependent Clp protease ATP-binding subunit ClpC
VARLVGAPPGYVGYEDAGQLTEAVRRRPYCVVCFDEVEKAHNEALSILLQIMEDGHLSDARGRQVDFRNAIVIMTSNLGAEVLARGASIGFAVYRDETTAAEESYLRMKEKLLDELKRTFRPEFLNRVDGMVVFHTLSQEQIEQIVDLTMEDVSDRLEGRGLVLELSAAAREFLAQEGYSKEYGARPLRQVIQRRVEDPLCEGLLAGDFVQGDTILVEVVDEELRLRTARRADGLVEGSPVPVAEAR